MGQPSSGSAPRGPSELYRKLVEGKISSKDYLSRVKKSNTETPRKKSTERSTRLNGAAGAALSAVFLLFILTPLSLTLT
jgi:hypothetical protein